VIISVEGPDGCGKTTFAQALERQMQIPLIPYRSFAVGSERNEELAFVQMCSFAPISLHFDFIRDRHLMTNMVYTKVYGKGELIDYWNRYLELIGNTEILIAYICAPFLVLLKRLQQRKKETGVKERKDIHSRLLQILTTFETAWAEIAGRYPHKIIRLDGMKSTEKMIQDFLKRTERKNSEAVH